MSFHENFNKFRIEFAQERNIINALSSINTKAAQDVKNEYTELINSQTLLSRLHYIAHSSHNFSLEELLFTLKKIEHLSISSSFKIFEKSNHKDRYSYLILYLKDRVEMLAQIVYFALLTPNNNVYPIPDLTSFTEDDVIYFCFKTFPTMYNYFISQDDQKAGISLISNLFRLHIDIHGPNFGKSHKFLSHFVSSFFLSTNPGLFFESSLKPLIVEFLPKLVSVQYKYEMVNRKSLIRTEYWQLCIIFSAQLLKSMSDNAPLMPTAARFLITEISKINADGFPFSELFIFEAMICEYLENQQLSIDTVLLRDVCNVIRCSYPQDIIPSPIYSILSQMNNQFIGVISIFQTIESLKLDKFENDPLSNAIKNCEVFSLYTPRDLTLIYRSVDIFLHFADEDKVTELASNFKEVFPPVVSDDMQYCPVKVWNSADIKTKFNIRVTSDFDEIIDCFTTIDSSKLKLNAVSDLSSMSILYCKASLNLGQIIKISNLDKTFNNDSLIDLKGNRSILSEKSGDLFTALFSISTEKERNTQQSLKLLSLFMRWKLLPFMHELYPFDFNFNSRDIFSAKDEETISRVYRAIEIHIVPLNLPPEIDGLIKKALVLMYLDQLDKMYNYQANSANNSLEVLLKRYVNSVLSGQVYTRSHRIVAKKAIDMLKSLDEFSSPSHNIEVVLDAMKFLNILDDADVMLVFAQSHNKAVFGLINFLRTYVTDKKMEAIIFQGKDADYIKRFINVGVALRTKKL